MGWSPLSAGDGRVSHHTFTTDTGIFSLSGVLGTAIAMHLEDINNNNLLYVCTGTWTVTNGALGLADFAPSVADTTTGSLGKPGMYKAYPVVTLATGPVAMDSQLLQVISEP
jgi:hypothetical protein